MTDIKTAQESILEVIQKIKEENGIATSDGKAPAYAHEMLDAMLAAKTEIEGPIDIEIKAAPGWAHGLLDLIWDLLF